MKQAIDSITRPVEVGWPGGPVRSASVTQIREGDTVATRWEVTEGTPATRAAGPVYGTQVSELSRRWPVLALAAVGAVGLLAGAVWGVIVLVGLLVDLVAAVLPYAIGGAALLGLLLILFAGGGGCPGLHCGGCKR